MTIVTKLPSEAEKKKEAEANEAPLVQVTVVIIILMSKSSSSLSSSSNRGEQGACRPGFQKNSYSHRSHHHIDIKVIDLEPDWLILCQPI